jgi:hypothetical protein
MEDEEMLKQIQAMLTDLESKLNDKIDNAVSELKNDIRGSQ